MPSLQSVTILPKFRSLIPPLTDDELAQLEANILADGCRDPLVLWEGVLLDGHNRYAICQKHDLPFKTVTLKFDDEEEAMDWIDANQLGRRNLTADQRSIIRGRRYNRTKKSAHGREGRTFSESQSDTPKDTATEIAKQHGVSRATVIRDGKRFEAIEKLAPEKRDAVFSGARKFNEVRREEKAESVKKAVQLPDAKFRVFYCDPPWAYNDKCDEGSVQSGGVEKHYPSMTIAELCALKVKAIAADDAVLFLWVTSPLLFECAPVITSFGFEYKASFVWDKVKHNMGHYNSVRHEFLLICTRGSCLPDTNKLIDSVQSIERTTHSTKPEEFRKIIEELYPHGKRLEMFARKKSEGWATFGNEC